MSAKGKARGLGRGLDALFADQAPIVQPDSPQALKNFTHENVNKFEVSEDNIMS